MCLLFDSIPGTITLLDYDLYSRDHTVNVCMMILLFSVAMNATIRPFGPGVDPILFDQVSCNGSERRLLDCPNRVFVNCNHNQDAGVQCIPGKYNKPNDVPGFYGGIQFYK